VYFADGNGNIGQVVSLSASSVSAAMYARYEYDPYGNLRSIAENSGYVSNPFCFRFSTKYFDVETGLGYWGYRYYSPTTGRWLSRDPIEEPGAVLSRQAARPVTTCRADALSYVGSPLTEPTGTFHEQEELNLYQYAKGAPTNHVDPFGLSAYCGRRYCACRTNPAWVDVYGVSLRAKLILEAGFGRGAQGCVTLPAGLFTIKMEIYCTYRCPTILTILTGRPPQVILNHECCHACDYYDPGGGAIGLIKYAQGAANDTCDRRRVGGWHTWRP
jgi:RHS repeat-associated protein